MGNNIDFCLVFCFVDLFSYHFFFSLVGFFFFPCGFVCFIIYDCYYFFSHVLRRIAHPMVSLFHPTRSPTKSNQKSIWGLNDIIETRKRKPKKKNNGGNSLVLPSKKSNCYQHPVILLISFFFTSTVVFFTISLLVTSWIIFPPHSSSLLRFVNFFRGSTQSR